MRVGILASPHVTQWQQNALRNIRKIDGVSINLVVVNAAAREGSSASAANAVNTGSHLSLADIRFFFQSFAERGFRTFLYADQKLGAILLDETKRLSNLASKQVDEVNSLGGVPRVDCEPVPAGNNWMRIPDDVLEIVENSCDVLIRFGFGLLKGEILSVTDHGVLSAHGSDIREYRGMGPRITFMRKEEDVCVTLQQLTETIDGGRIVDIDCRPIEWPYTHDDIRGLVHDILVDIFEKGIRKLMDPSFTPWEPTQLGEYHSHAKGRSPRFVGKFLLQNNIARLKKYSRR